MQATLSREGVVGSEVEAVARWVQKQVVNRMPKSKDNGFFIDKQIRC